MYSLPQSFDQAGIQSVLARAPNAQVPFWQDAAGLNSGRTVPWSRSGRTSTAAAAVAHAYADDGGIGVFPGPERTFH